MDAESIVLRPRPVFSRVPPRNSGRVVSVRKRKQKVCWQYGTVSMERTAHTYRIAHIPDPFCYAFQIATGGDVRSAAFRECERILRTVVTCLPDLRLSPSVSFMIQSRQALTSNRALACS